MKWLIILILIGCGKHQEPNHLDLRDSDGDQVLNHEESELDKFVADFETLGKVKGVLKFNLDKIIEIPITNELDYKNNALSLIVSNEKKLIHEDYFAEWSKLRLSGDFATPDLKLSHYTIHLQFEHGPGKAQELLLVKGPEVISLGKWSQVMRLQLSSENLSAILSNKAFLSIKKNFRKSPLFQAEQDKTIRDKTYRVHYYDGSKSKILYVSKSMAFPKLLENLRISPERIDQEEVFFNSDLLSANEWYIRELLNGDKVIVYSNMAELKGKFLEKYTYQRHLLSRVNGEAKTTVKFNNAPDAKIFVRVSSLKYTVRSFYEETERRTHGGGGGGGREGNASSPYKCTHYLRKVKKEETILADLNNLFQNLNQEEMLLGAQVEEEMDGQGLFWEMKLNATPANLEWTFSNRPSSTYTVTGEYNNSCGEAANRGRGAAYRTNSEGKFETVIESFVEKIAE